ncbi:hypothetical protein PCC7424_5803 (plasmid) [Gloeothece citriformis PCC 7424]|uniref:Uncharacterized protein n=1 Tax=Gloeothece citriformis (strain PCC 7424) TaxID=65393 RepID=B7KM42_GLOC7|nr:hypothetical protein [Gloeothece citriformis]ACK73864.1 hypothetical protein PCC7424_5803 [Gloeothece citriformis PCC 7424]
MSESNNLPVIEIIFVTGISTEDIEVESLPVLNVFYDEQQQQYLITDGCEIIKNALANCFQTLNQQSALSLMLAVNLKIKG